MVFDFLNVTPVLIPSWSVPSPHPNSSPLGSRECPHPTFQPHQTSPLPGGGSYLSRGSVLISHWSQTRQYLALYGRSVYEISQWSRSVETAGPPMGLASYSIIHFYLKYFHSYSLHSYLIFIVSPALYEFCNWHFILIHTSVSLHICFKLWYIKLFVLFCDMLLEKSTWFKRYTFRAFNL